jgi:hypothetical protein
MSDTDQRSETSPEYTLAAINSIDDDGTWVRGFDANGMEVELTITGLTADRIREFLSGKPVRVRPS